jgi:UDP-N-acetylenolpyruvoylglucosamine reductase
MIGRGSNVIVREGGIRGAVVHPDGGEFDELTVADDGTIEAGAGVRLKKIAGAAAQAALPGFEWMDGIPGNVGGSLRMNAGSMGQCMKALLVSVTSLEEDGSIRTRSGDELSAVYRSIPELVNNFALKATFKSPVVEEGEEPVTKESITEKIEASRKWRRAMQPIGNSAGCIFKNPESIPAGKLIDELGLKGTSIGDAYISDVHANFIINRGNARATDVTELIDLVRKKALEERGIELKSEAQVIGDREPQF